MPPSTCSIGTPRSPSAAPPLIQAARRERERSNHRKVGRCLSAWPASHAMGYDIMADYNDSYPIGYPSFDGAPAIAVRSDENDTRGRQFVDLPFPGTCTRRRGMGHVLHFQFLL
jgi:hypothetical protein